MYQYHHRIADRFGRPVASLALLADARPNWRPGGYEEELWGCRVRFEYPVCKLLDLDETALGESTNPAATVLLAHLEAQRNSRNPEGRKRAKWALTRRLYERGFERRQIRELFRLIDWLMALPEELAVEFRQELLQYERVMSMPYITSIERLGRQEGRQEGALSEARKAVLEAIGIRFGPVPDDVRSRIESLGDLSRLRDLLRAALTVSSLDAVLGVDLPTTD